MKYNFNFYEFVGVIVPGAVLVLGLSLLLPESQKVLNESGVTFGELGIILIISYAAGQAVQGVGNLIEWVWWRIWGGLPSTRILFGQFVSSNQHERIISALREIGHEETHLSKCTNVEKKAIIREVYSLVRAAGQSERVDTFNGNYGLLRGLTASLILLLIYVLLSGGSPQLVGVLSILLLLSLLRMHRFGVHYSVELFVQFLLVVSPSNSVSIRSNKVS